MKRCGDKGACEMTGYRDALIETAVALNAAQAAFSLRREVAMAGHWEIEVLYGVYNLVNHQVCMPNNPTAPPTDENVVLAHAPSNPTEFRALALQMAALLDPRKGNRTETDSASNGVHSPTPIARDAAGNSHDRLIDKPQDG